MGAVLTGLAALAVVRLTDPLIGPDPGKVALLGQVLAATLVGAVVYALYTRLMRIPELDQTVSIIRSSLRRGGSG